MRRVHCFVAGRVQGVWFRGSTHQEARALRLSGWVRNTAGGRVELVAEGAAASVERLLAWLRTGPPAAEVEALDVKDEKPTGAEPPFEIRRT